MVRNNTNFGEKGGKFQKLINSTWCVCDIGRRWCHIFAWADDSDWLPCVPRSLAHKIMTHARNVWRRPFYVLYPVKCNFAINNKKPKFYAQCVFYLAVQATRKRRDSEECSENCESAFFAEYLPAPMRSIAVWDVFGVSRKTGWAGRYLLLKTTMSIKGKNWKNYQFYFKLKWFSRKTLWGKLKSILLNFL